MSAIGNFIFVFTQILTFAIVIRVILAWFPIGPNNPFFTLVYQVTEPILGPLRRILPRVGALDFTPMVAIILLYVIQQIAFRAF